MSSTRRIPAHSIFMLEGCLTLTLDDVVVQDRTSVSMYYCMIISFCTICELLLNWRRSPEAFSQHEQTPLYRVSSGYRGKELTGCFARTKHRDRYAKEVLQHFDHSRSLDRPLMKLRAKAMSRGRITPRAGAQVAALCRIFDKLLAASRANRRPR
jgi:hypothetical protein